MGPIHIQRGGKGEREAGRKNGWRVEGLGGGGGVSEKDAS